jgi:Resolvase, N terminal domain
LNAASNRAVGDALYWSVVTVTTVDYGASLERPGIQGFCLRQDSAQYPLNVLLVDDSSRVSRDLADAIRFLQQLKFFGVRVIYISQNIDSDHEQAETLIAVHGVVDSLYLREMSKKVKRGLAGQLERWFATGSRTYGYRAVPVLDPTGKNDAHGRPALLGKRIEIQPDEARIIVQISSGTKAGSARCALSSALRSAISQGRAVRHGNQAPSSAFWRTRSSPGNGFGDRRPSSDVLAPINTPCASSRGIYGTSGTGPSSESWTRISGAAFRLDEPKYVRCFLSIRIVAGG